MIEGRRGRVRVREEGAGGGEAEGGKDGVGPVLALVPVLVGMELWTVGERVRGGCVGVWMEKVGSQSSYDYRRLGGWWMVTGYDEIEVFWGFPDKDVHYYASTSTRTMHHRAYHDLHLLRCKADRFAKDGAFITFFLCVPYVLSCSCLRLWQFARRSFRSKAGEWLGHQPCYAYVQIGQVLRQCISLALLAITATL